MDSLFFIVFIHDIDQIDGVERTSELQRFPFERLWQRISSRSVVLVIVTVVGLGDFWFGIFLVHKKIITYNNYQLSRCDKKRK